MHTRMSAVRGHSARLCRTDARLVADFDQFRPSGPHHVRRRKTADLDQLTTRHQHSRRSRSPRASARWHAALLLAAAAPRPDEWARADRRSRPPRSPRRPLSRSNSRSTGERMVASTASIALSGRRARPELLCSTVRLMTGRSARGSRLQRDAQSPRAARRVRAPRQRAPSASRRSLSWARTAATTAGRPAPRSRP